MPAERSAPSPEESTNRSGELITEVPKFAEAATDTGPVYEMPSAEQQAEHSARAEEARAAVEAATPAAAPVAEAGPRDHLGGNESFAYTATDHGLREREQTAAREAYNTLNGLTSDTERAAARATAAEAQSGGPVRKLWNRLTGRA